MTHRELRNVVGGGVDTLRLSSDVKRALASSVRTTDHSRIEHVMSYIG